MSFIVRDGQVRDHRLALVRRKYFHGILEYNQDSQRDRRQADELDRRELNQKFSRINQEALESLQTEMTRRKREKLYQQELLKQEYERQIRDRSQRLRRERENDKKYAKLQQIETERTSERRAMDLLKIYDRASIHASQRRVKTDVEESPNPQSKLVPSLPHIERINFTSNLKHQELPLSFQNRSQRSLSSSQAQP